MENKTYLDITPEDFYLAYQQLGYRELQRNVLVVLNLEVVQEMRVAGVVQKYV